MKEFLLEVIKTIFTSVLGAFFGCLFTKLFDKNKKENNIVIDKQLNFVQIQYEQKNNIYNQSITNRVSRKREGGQAGNNSELGGILALIIIISVYSIFMYLKYEHRIVVIMNIINAFLSTMLFTTTYITIRKYKVDAAIKSILIFNLVGTVCSFLLLYFVENPIMYSDIDKQYILTQIIENGVFWILTEAQVFGFILYQFIGMLIIFAFMVYILMGTIHVLSTINLTLQNKFTKVWKFLFKMTFCLCKSIKVYICIGSVLLCVGFLYVSGVLAKILFAGVVTG